MASAAQRLSGECLHDKPSRNRGREKRTQLRILGVSAGTPVVVRGTAVDDKCKNHVADGAVAAVGSTTNVAIFVTQ